MLFAPPWWHPESALWICWAHHVEGNTFPLCNFNKAVFHCRSPSTRQTRLWRSLVNVSGPSKPRRMARVSSKRTRSSMREGWASSSELSQDFPRMLTCPLSLPGTPLVSHSFLSMVHKFSACDCLRLLPSMHPAHALINCCRIKCWALIALISMLQATSLTHLYYISRSALSWACQPLYPFILLLVVNLNEVWIDRDGDML